MKFWTISWWLYNHCWQEKFPQPLFMLWFGENFICLSKYLWLNQLLFFLLVLLRIRLMRVNLPTIKQLIRVQCNQSQISWNLPLLGIGWVMFSSRYGVLWNYVIPLNESCLFRSVLLPGGSNATQTGMYYRVTRTNVVDLMTLDTNLYPFSALQVSCSLVISCFLVGNRGSCSLAMTCEESHADSLVSLGCLVGVVRPD